MRAGALRAEDARAGLRVVRELPLEVVPARELAGAALEVALARGLTAYDGCHAALAEASGAVLVTADGDLAGAVRRSALLPAAGPPG